MDLRTLGYDSYFEEAFARRAREGTVAGRIAVDYAQDYLVYTEKGELRAEVPGRLRRALELGDVAKPAVGDWVVVETHPSPARSLIVDVLPRRSRLSRKVPGRTVEEQVVASNVDVIFLVVAATAGINLRRLERNLTLAHESGAKPAVILTKIDLFPEPSKLAAEVEGIAGGAPVHLVSNLTGEGVHEVADTLRPAQTIVLVGTSGAGKSSLVNRWLGEERQTVAEVREWDQKGRHTTTHRELFRLPGGALVIDTPGVRELALWEAEAGLEETFPEIAELAALCRFADCRHEREPGCAVVEAADEGRVEPSRLQAYRKLAREREELERRKAERGRIERRRLGQKKVR